MGKNEKPPTGTWLYSLHKGILLISRYYSFFWFHRYNFYIYIYNTFNFRLKIEKKKEIYYTVIKNQLFKFISCLRINIIPSKKSDYKTIPRKLETGAKLEPDYDSSFLQKLLQWISRRATWLTNQRNLSTRDLQHPLIADASLIKRRHRNPRRMRRLRRHFISRQLWNT